MSNLSLFSLFSQNLARYHRVLSFIIYLLVTVLQFESFENNLFKLDFSISKKNLFLQSNLLRKVIFCTVMKYLF